MGHRGESIMDGQVIDDIKIPSWGPNTTRVEFNQVMIYASLAAGKIHSMPLDCCEHEWDTKENL